MVQTLPILPPLVSEERTNGGAFAQGFDAWGRRKSGRLIGGSRGGYCGLRIEGKWQAGINELTAFEYTIGRLRHMNEQPELSAG